MITLQDRIDELKRSISTMQNASGRFLTVVFPNEYLKMAINLVDLLERETFSTEELSRIYRALGISGDADLAERVWEYARVRRTEEIER